MLVSWLLVPALVASAPPAPSIRPIWITVLPNQADRIYGMGVAALTETEAVAVQQASDNARADVIARLRANVKSDTRITTSYQETRNGTGNPTTTRTQSAEVGTQVQAQASDLPGMVVEETFLDRPGQTSYALAYLDLAIAQRELRARLGAVASDLAVDRGVAGSRGKLVLVQALNKARNRLVQLEDQAELLSGGGGDPQLRNEVLQGRQEVERRLVTARAALTFGFAPTQDPAVGPALKNAVRTAVVQQGMAWTDRDPLFTITLDASSSRQGIQLSRGNRWDYQRQADLVVARGNLELTLADRDGQEYESTSVSAKGVGIDVTQADILLMSDFRTRLSKAVADWLANIGKW